MLVLLLVVWVGFANPAQSQDTPVPKTAQLKEAKVLIKDIYGQQIKEAGSGEQLSDLAKVIRQAANDSKSVLPQYYALLKKAIELATTASDSVLAVDLINELDREFEIDAKEMTIDVLTDCASKSRGMDRNRAATHIGRLLNEAMLADDTRYMKTLASLGFKVASKAKAPRLINYFRDAKRQIVVLADQVKDFERATVTLAKNPDDPKANQKMGEYYCFAKSDWDQGLTYLAKSESNIKPIAVAELEKPQDARGQLDLARKWAAAAEDLPDFKNKILQRSAHWYSLAIAQLQGLRLKQAKMEFEKLEFSTPVLLDFKSVERYVISGGTDGKLRVWDVQSGVEKFAVGSSGGFRAISMSPSGKFFASGDRDNLARIWSIETGKLTHSLTGHRSDVGAVSYSPDGKWLATGDASGNIFVWDAETGAKKNNIDLKVPKLWDLAWKPDGRQIAAAMGDGSIFLIDVASGVTRKVSAHTDDVRSICYSPDGTRLASASHDKTVKMWNTRDMTVEGTIAAHDRAVTSVDFSPDGKQIVTASDDKSVKIWTDQGKLVGELEGHSNFVYQAIFSPSGKLIGSASWDRTVILWDAKTGTQISTFREHTASVYGLDFGF